MTRWLQRLPDRMVQWQRRSPLAATVRRLGRRVTVRLSRTARAEARAAALPRRYRWLRVGSLGPAPVPAHGLVVRDLLERPLRAGDRTLDVLLVPGVSAGGPRQLSRPVAEALISCERRTTPTVLIAAAGSDLATPLAAICHDVLTTDADIAEQAQGLVGVENTRLLDAGTAHSTEAWRAALLELCDRRV